MKIAVIGTGTIGTTIAKQWQQQGHQILYGTRDPQSPRHAPLTESGEVRDIDDAIEAADAVLLAIPGNAVEDLLQTHGSALNGKRVFDATNAMSGGTFHQFSRFETAIPQAHVYRAFNTLGWENFAEPTFGTERADLFYAGPDGTDRETIERLIADVGLRPVYVGEGAQAFDLLDGLTRLWFTLALQRGHGRHLAFRTLGLD